MTEIMEIINQNCLIFEIGGVTITSIVIIIGWIVTNNFAKKRQARIEQLAKKEELYKEIDKLVIAAREYYVGDIGKRKIANLEIVDQTGNIDRIIGIIEAGNSELYKKYTVLYEAITDGSFGSDENIDSKLSEEKYKRIILAKNQLCIEIEAKFNHIK